MQPRRSQTDLRDEERVSGERQILQTDRQIDRQQYTDYDEEKCVGAARARFWQSAICHCCHSLVE